MLQWIKIADLVVDPTYQRPILGKGRKNVDRIARSFSWSCFAPVVVAPIQGDQRNYNTDLPDGAASSGAGSAGAVGR
jgi:hypothetical protein